jgi:protein-disulfide isomerase
MASRKQQKEAARAEREARQHADAAAARRRRAMAQLGGLLAVAAVVVGVLIAVSSSGEKTPAPRSQGQGLAGVAESAQLLGGVIERGLTLGRSDAPLTLVEYADMQCPACRAYSEQVFPELVQRYVRPGKLRIELRLQSFLGEDSVTAARAVAAAAAQNRAWPLVDLLYRNQGQENSGYVTRDFVLSLSRSVPGLDEDRLLRDQSGAAAQRMVHAGSAAFARLGFQGTPSFQLGRTGGDLSVLTVRQLTPAEFTGPIDSLLAK